MECQYEQMEALIQLVRTAIRYSNDAHDSLFEKKNLFSTVGFLNSASSKMAAAEALYYAAIENLEHQDIEEVFHKFDVFCNELLTNIATDHSHQWSDIEFQALIQSFDNSVCK